MATKTTIVVGVFCNSLKYLFVILGINFFDKACAIKFSGSLGPIVFSNFFMKAAISASILVIENDFYNALTPWGEDVLYSTAYTFIDIWRAIPATKLLATSSYKLGFYRYGWGSRTFCNITVDSIYILIQGWLSMTQLLLEHSWRSDYNENYMTRELHDTRTTWHENCMTPILACRSRLKQLVHLSTGAVGSSVNRVVKMGMYPFVGNI